MQPLTLELSALAPGMTAIEHEGARILLIRDGDGVRAFEGACPHAKAPLDKGALCAGRIICPWHMAAFDAQTGALLEPVADRGLQRYPVTVDGDTVSVSLDAEPAPRRSVSTGLHDIVLAGAGAAATAAAFALREHGFGGRIIMLGPDGSEPLDRTQLSKMALSAPDFDRTTLPLSDGLEVERRLVAVTGLDSTAKHLTLSDGSTLSYDALLLATGAAPKTPPFPGGEHALTLRHLGDVDAILARFTPGKPVVIIGTSFIGMEAASALAERGGEVTVVGQDEVPFAKLLGPRVGGALQRLHESKGVRFRLGVGVAGLEPDAVLLDSGELLPAGLIVAGLGVAPALDYAGELPRREDGGLATDGSLRVTEGVWAAGDIASPEGWPRIEHWRLAQQHGRIAALDMLGVPARYEGVPFFWSAQGGKRLQMLGHIAGPGDTVYDGDVERFDFVAWYLEAGRVRAALICGNDRAAAILSYAMQQELTLEDARQRIA